MTVPDPPQMRADALRNRDLLLASASSLFVTEGLEVSLKAIARHAGVGIGTLFRHFPSREALIDEVYRTELAAVAALVPGLLGVFPPREALRAWMDHYMEYMTTDTGMAVALREVVTSRGLPYARSRAILTSAIAALLNEATAEGNIRNDVPADDVLAALGGIALAAGRPSQRDQAARLMNLLMAGLAVAAASDAGHRRGGSVRPK